MGTMRSKDVCTFFTIADGKHRRLGRCRTVISLKNLYRRCAWELEKSSQQPRTPDACSLAPLIPFRDSWVLNHANASQKARDGKQRSSEEQQRVPHANFCQLFQTESRQTERALHAPNRSRTVVIQQQSMLSGNRPSATRWTQPTGYDRPRHCKFQPFAL